MLNKLRVRVNLILKSHADLSSNSTRDKIKLLRIAKLDMALGMCPNILLELRSSVARFVQLKIYIGMFPDNPLPCSDIIAKFRRERQTGGRVLSNSYCLSATSPS
jgi:hypothetical protein